ncbi:MAG: hotdog fold thioesterase [FCB group bacterium]|nr:hotdog fold thioesterase [FCB group bacterium]
MKSNKEILAEIRRISRNTMADHLGIEFTDVGENYLCGKMPVDHRTVQPMGSLHGGASVALAETLASVAGTLTIDYPHQYCVGLEINANHIKGVTGGWVHGRTEPIYLGKRTQVWETRITDDDDNLICISRMTLVVRSNRK